MTESPSPVLSDDVQALVATILAAADDRGFTLATAESGTGGLIASLLTDVEGRSHVFERGYVVCTDDAKADELAVPPRLLKAHGAVSGPVACAMAEGALRTSGADVALAITGYPEAAGADEAGRVHFAVAAVGAPTMQEERRFGDIGRGPCRIECVRVALTVLKAAVTNR